MRTDRLQRDRDSIPVHHVVKDQMIQLQVYVLSQVLRQLMMQVQVLHVQESLLQLHSPIDQVMSVQVFLHPS